MTDRRHGRGSAKRPQSDGCLIALASEQQLHNCWSPAATYEDGLYIDAYCTIRSLLLSISFPRIIMSSISSTSTSQTNFAYIFYAALESYRRKTKKDLASHPLLADLQDCHSPDDVLSFMRERIPSQNSDNEISKWVVPTVNSLDKCSDTLGKVVELVNISTLHFGGTSI